MSLQPRVNSPAANEVRWINWSFFFFGLVLCSITSLPSSIYGEVFVNFAVVAALLPLSLLLFFAPPYVAVQRSVTAQSSGEDGSISVPLARGLDLLWRTHTTLKGTLRGCTKAHTHTHTHKNMNTGDRLECTYAIWTHPGEQAA